MYNLLLRWDRYKAHAVLVIGLTVLRNKLQLFEQNTIFRLSSVLLITAMAYFKSHIMATAQWLAEGFVIRLTAREFIKKLFRVSELNSPLPGIWSMVTNHPFFMYGGGLLLYYTMLLVLLFQPYRLLLKVTIRFKATLLPTLSSEYSLLTTHRNTSLSEYLFPIPRRLHLLASDNKTFGTYLYAFSEKV